MHGGGFLKQGADSAKYNRSLLGKEAHKPFERREGKVCTGQSVSIDKTMSDELKQELLEQALEFNRSEIRAKITVAVTVFVMLIVALVVMFW